VLRVCAALDMFECFLRHCGTERALDLGEGGDVAIMHDGVDPECERMVVGWCDGRCSSCPNMSEKDRRGGIGAKAAEVGVVKWRLDVLVECWVEGWLG